MIEVKEILVNNNKIFRNLFQNEEINIFKILNKIKEL
jgi:hypothetical protein